MEVILIMKTTALYSWLSLVLPQPHRPQLKRITPLGVSWRRLSSSAYVYPVGLLLLAVMGSSQTARSQTPAPVLTQPTEISSTSFIAAWSSVSDATNYRLQVATSPGFEVGDLVTGFNALSTGTATQRLLSNLNPGSNYFVHVQAQTSEDTSDYSAAINVSLPKLASALAPVVALVNQTNYQRYLDTLLYTHMGDNRGPGGAQHDLARSNIFSHFTSLGLQTRLDPFPYQEQTFYNVVGVLPGTTARSNETYIVCGHYDSVDNPGADDDASGVAGVMEAARVLSQYRFGATVVFIAFDLEEVDLVGSKSYASQHQTDYIGGVVSLDMIAHNSNAGNATAIYGNESSSPIKLALSNAVALYAPSLVTTVCGPTPDSDHDSFEVLGFQGCLLIENGTNSLYHEPTDSVDTLGYIDYAFATEMTRAAVGYLATQAGLVDPAPATPLRLLHPATHPGYVFSFDLEGEQGKTALVQFSANLVHWQDLNPYPLQDSPVQVLITNSPNEAKRFYRAVISGSNPTNWAVLDTYIEQWLTSNKVSSTAVAIIKSGQLILAKGYGLANRETAMLANCDTLYSMASCSKPFVGLSALKLVEQGKLNLDEDISTYLGFTVRNPNFPGVSITMRQLLAHVASVVDADDRTVAEYPRPDPVTPLEDYVRSALIAGGALYKDGAFWNADHQPGEYHKYANMGSTLAGLVIQKAADQPFNQYCNQNLFTPLGMNNTRWFYAELPNPSRVALPYNENFVSYGIYGFDEWPSGQIRSSVNEWANLMIMLINRGEWNGQRILQPSSIDEFQRVQFPAADATACLQLFKGQSAEGVTQYSHTGGEAGVVTYFLYDVNKNGAIVLCNTDLAKANENADSVLMQRLLQETR